MISRTHYSKLCRLIMLAMSCSLVSGCFEDTKQEFTLNPDGSGKMVLESSFVPASEAISEETEGESGLREIVRDILTKSDGIEAWRDVSFSEQKDGAFSFRGTAYFPDLSRVKLHQFASVSFSVQKDSANNLVLTQVEQPVSHKSDFPGANLPSLNEPITQESISRDRRR